MFVIDLGVKIVILRWPQFVSTNNVEPRYLLYKLHTFDSVQVLNGDVIADTTRSIPQEVEPYSNVERRAVFPSIRAVR